MKKRKKSLVGYTIEAWRSQIKLIGSKPDRYYQLPEIGEEPISYSRKKVRITIEDI